MIVPDFFDPTAQADPSHGAPEWAPGVPHGRLWLPQMAVFPAENGMIALHTVGLDRFRDDDAPLMAWVNVTGSLRRHLVLELLCDDEPRWQARCDSVPCGLTARHGSDLRGVEPPEEKLQTRLTYVGPDREDVIVLAHPIVLMGARR